MLDGLVAATAGLIAIGLVGGDEPALALLPTAIGALYIGGAVSGNNKANACRKEMDEYSSMIAARDTLDRQRPRFEQYDVDRARDVPVAPPKRPAQPAPEPNPYDEEEQQETAAPPTPAPQAVAKPQPQQPTRGPAKKLPPPKPKQDEDEWTDFWREVD